MCGFVGIINKNGNQVNLSLLERMASLLEHRGPDDEGFHIKNNIGFYHKRLSIIDIENGHQPMHSYSNCIVYNGEIYNYIELREELKNKNHNFKTNSDTEVILEAYHEYGIDLFNKLNGMFAFLIHDKKRNRVIAARDHFGIKPLYYFVNNEHIIFASEIKAILQHPAVKAEPNNSSLNEYLTFQYTLGKNTLFNYIHKVLPGNYLKLDLNSMKIETNQYWNFEHKIDTTHSEEYFIKEIRLLLEDSVKKQLRSDVPLGAHLSGGLDSSTISLLSTKFSGEKLSTFTGAFNEGPEYDETSYAAKVAEQCNAEMYKIYPTEQNFINLLPKLIFSLDEPVAGPGVFPQYMVSKLASENVKVVLGGQGGDEIFGGYARYIVAYLEQAIKGAIFEDNDEGEHIVSLHSIVQNLPYLKQYTPMLKSFWNADVFAPMDQRYFKLINRFNGSSNILTEEFSKDFDKEKVYATYQKLFNKPSTLSYFNKMTQYDLTTNLPALLQVEDRTSMSVSLESRVPLLDYRIVELIATMPPAMKFKGGEMKYIFKKVIADILPEKILQRKDKIGFAVPLNHWLKSKTSDFFKDIMLSTKARNRGIFNTNEVLKLIDNERLFGRKLWGIICLELWYQQFIDKD